MEEKIGYAVISIEDYKELVEDNIALENWKNDLLDEKNKLKKELKELKSFIASKIFRDEEYHLEQIIIEGGEVRRDYHFNYIQTAFHEYGIIDINFIDEGIKQYFIDRENETNE